MNTDQVAGIARALLSAAGGWAVGAGYLDSNTATAVAGALVTILTAIWSAYSNRPGTVIPAKP